MGDQEFTLEDVVRLETRICELEEELTSVTKRKDEREHAVRQYETWLREARRERDEARSELSTLRALAGAVVEAEHALRINPFVFVPDSERNARKAARDAHVDALAAHLRGGGK